VKTAVRIRINRAQLLQAEKQVNRSDVASVAGRLKRIFPFAPIAAGLYRNRLQQVFWYPELSQNEPWVNRLKQE
jgi:hypothetical protein